MSISVNHTVRVLALQEVLQDDIDVGLKIDPVTLEADWWRRSGLRMRDLRLLLATMARRREVLRVDASERSCYVLTASGVDFLRAGYRDESRWPERLWARMQLRRLRHRVTAAPAARQSPRRLEDRATSLGGRG